MVVNRLSDPVFRSNRSRFKKVIPLGPFPDLARDSKDGLIRCRIRSVTGERVPFFPHVKIDCRYELCVSDAIYHGVCR